MICLLCFPSIFCCSLPLIHMSAVPEFELPKAVVARIIKGALPEGVQVGKEAKDAIQIAAGIFILHLTNAANEACQEGKRSTINDKDMDKALREIGLEDYIPPMLASLEAWKASQAAKKTAKGAANDE
uniref:Transcription factor CBF/NF-Y/archaeal histone domain-containing protein n=1 Tax=Vannella robusta TaxID=1487602 RepID=A0A7S4IA61_9EUKA